MTITLSPNPFLSGTFGSTGQSAAWHAQGKFTAMIYGGIATVQIERSVNSGSTWVAASKNSDGAVATYDVTAATPVSLVIEEPEEACLYRFNCTAFTSSVNYRFSK